MASPIPRRKIGGGRLQVNDGKQAEHADEEFHRDSCVESSVNCISAFISKPVFKITKKPTWLNAQRRSTTSAYSATGLPANRNAFYLVVRQLYSLIKQEPLASALT